MSDEKAENASTNHPEFGTLLSEPDISTLRDSQRSRAMGIITVAMCLILPVVFPLAMGEPSGLMIVVSVISSLLIVGLFWYGILLYTHADAMKLQIYQYAVIDHFCLTGRAREIPVRSYYVNNDAIYGVDKEGTDIKLIDSRDPFRKQIYDQVISDL